MQCTYYAYTFGMFGTEVVYYIVTKPELCRILPSSLSCQDAFCWYAFLVRYQFRRGSVWQRYTAPLTLHHLSSLSTTVQSTLPDRLQVCTSPPSSTNRCTVVYHQPTKPVRFCTFQTSILVCLCMQLQSAAPVCFMHLSDVYTSLLVHATSIGRTSLLHACTFKQPDRLSLYSQLTRPCHWLCYAVSPYQPFIPDHRKSNPWYRLMLERKRPNKHNLDPNHGRHLRSEINLRLPHGKTCKRSFQSLRLHATFIGQISKHSLITLQCKCARWATAIM